MRTKKSIRNSVIAAVTQIALILIRTVSRKFFIIYLGNNILGLNSVFTQIISILSLVELGIGPAIIFNLYEPLSKGDHKKISAFMNFYKQAYKVIGVLVLVVGIGITPFVSFFIKDLSNIDVNIYIIFILFVFNSASSYFLAYKQSLLNANQEQYIVNIIICLATIVVNVAQVIILVLTKNYYLYLVLMIIFTLVQNITISFISDKKFSYLKETKNEQLSKNEKKSIYKNTSAMLLHKIGGVVSNTIDTLILSKNIGLVAAAGLSNYTLIISSIGGVINQGFNGITASVGQLKATDSKERNMVVFKQIYLINFFIASFTSVALFSLLNPFITLWLGSDFVFSTVTVAILVLNSYLGVMRLAVQTFKNAYGMYWDDRYKSIVEAAINLIASLALYKLLGVNGVLIGTTLSLSLTCIWIEPYVLFKNAFKMSMFDYFKRYAVFFVATITEIFIVFGINEYILNLGGGIVHFIIRIFVVIFIPIGLNIILFHKTLEFKQILEVLKNLLKGRRKGE